ncbi:MAG: murein L,D-transpeptidase [Planctomycetes bacterium]|nr:murein L,D-transpeptidase [Planctomycetota bacterium]
MTVPRRYNVRVGMWRSPALAEQCVREALGILVLFASAWAGAAEPTEEWRTHLAWQLALDRAGFSGGILDAQVGPKGRLAIREFQRARGLPATGGFDAKTAEALGVDPEKAVGTYTVQPADLAQLGPLPKTWPEKAKLSRLAYPTLDELLAEKFHCSRALLARLNPGKEVAQLKAGESLQVPAVAEAPPIARAEALDVNLAEKVIRARGKGGEVVGLFHCSIAADKERLPSGQATVVVISENPAYTFDPKMWPEVKDVAQKLTIPPGPRNPVGLCWIGLSLPGYGMHGTPMPEMIGKTGSHGCFRLTNWDALRLAKMVRVGTPVRFAGAPAAKPEAAAQRERH